MPGGAHLSIGALSRAAGVPVETLRTWERRYGFPRPLERDGTTHRRYPIEAVDRLRLIKRIIAFGHKPATVVAADASALADLLALHVAREPPSPRPILGDSRFASWTEAVRDFDASRFDRELVRAWDEVGALRFITERACPFLREVGERWADGSLGVAHEHFASERMRDFLAARRLALATGTREQTAVCATLPGDQHGLAAQMASVVLTLAGVEVVFLGADTPTAAIADVALDRGAASVVLSVAAGYDPSLLRVHVRALVARLGGRVALIGGGAGFTGPITGVRVLKDFEQLLNVENSTY